MMQKSLSIRDEVVNRGRFLMEQAVRSGDGLFVPEEGLLRLIHPTKPSYTGHVVAQMPLEYAIALLETGGDAQRANQIIRRTTDFQDRDAGSDTFGNFIWMTHWKTVQDRNAVSFMTPNYAYLWKHHREKLECTTRTCLEAVFPLALRGGRAHRIPPTYTNIFLLNLLSKLELAAILGEESARREALSDWDDWVAEVSQHAIDEYNSPSYTAVDLYALEGILDAAPNEGFRQQVEKMLAYVWTEFAANYHAGIKCLTGPMSRAYPCDYLYGNGLSAVAAFQQFGSEVASLDSDGGLTPFVVNFAIRRYVVPDAIRAIALDKTWPVLIRGSVPGRGISWTNYLDRDFALGSQTGYYETQEMPVFLAFRTRRKRRSLFFKSEPPVPVLASAQNTNKLLGGFTYPVGMKWSRFGERARESATICLHLGQSKYQRNRIIQPNGLGQRLTQLDSSRYIALDLGSVFVGIKAFVVGPSGEEYPAQLERRAGESLIVWPMGKHLSQSDTARSPVAAFFMVVVGRREYAGLEDFARHLEEYALSITPQTGRITIAADGGGAHLSIDAPPPGLPLAEYLHVSPFLRLAPGILAGQVRMTDDNCSK